MKRAVILLSLFFSTWLQAQDRGISLDGSLGQSTYPNINSSAVQNAKVKDTAYSLGLSYHFSSWFALKAGYVDLGSARYDTQLDSIIPGYDGPNGHLQWAADSYTLALVPSLPVTDRVKIFAELGWHSYDMATTNVFPELENGEFVNFSRESGTDSDDDSYYGLGVGWAINEKLSTNLTYKEYKVGEEDIRFVDVGLSWRF